MPLKPMTHEERLANLAKARAVMAAKRAERRTAEQTSLSSYREQLNLLMPAALKAIGDCLHASNGNLRLKAACEVLDRRWGKQTPFNPAEETNATVKYQSTVLDTLEKAAERAKN